MEKVIMLTDEYIIHLYMTRIQRFFNSSCRDYIRFPAEKSKFAEPGNSDCRQNIHLVFQGAEMLYVDCGNKETVLHECLPGKVVEKLKKHFPDCMISEHKVPDTVDISLLPSVENIIIMP